jgi:hypothetical protein
MIILYDIWIQDPREWSKRFKYIHNEHLHVLTQNFKQVKRGHISMEIARDNVRIRLHALNAAMFPLGAFGTSVGNLANEI